MSEHLIVLLTIPAFALGLVGSLLLALWVYTAPVRARHIEELRKLRRQYGDEYADWWGERMGMSSREIRRSRDKLLS